MQNCCSTSAAAGTLVYVVPLCLTVTWVWQVQIEFWQWRCTGSQNWDLLDQKFSWLNLLKPTLQIAVTALPFSVVYFHFPELGCFHSDGRQFGGRAWHKCQFITDMCVHRSLHLQIDLVQQCLYHLKTLLVTSVCCVYACHNFIIQKIILKNPAIFHYKMWYRHISWKNEIRWMWHFPTNNIKPVHTVSVCIYVDPIPIFYVFSVWHVYSASYVQYTLTERVDTPSVCAHGNKVAALRRLIQPCFLGGDPYGRSQSDVDGITATLVLMRSSLALMSDRMTGRGGPHGRQPGREADRCKHPYICIQLMHTHTQIYIQKYPM